MKKFIEFLRKIFGCKSEMTVETEVCPKCGKTECVCEEPKVVGDTETKVLTEDPEPEAEPVIAEEVKAETVSEVEKTAKPKKKRAPRKKKVTTEEK